MEIIRTANVHQATPEGCRLMIQKGKPVDTRNGPAWAFPCPFATTYLKPRQRVVFWADRDANPFFHFMECLWMLGGRRDVEWISEYSSNIRNYSDNGETFKGAYGYRWRHWFGFDQLDTIVQSLRLDPQDRRQVLQMWSPDDLLRQNATRDVPCNTSVFVQIVSGALDILVSNRSNDLVWGAYGANAVHFSFLQEVLAARIGVPVGKYTQFSMNTHIYERHWELARVLSDHAPDVMSGQRAADADPYSLRGVAPYPIVKDPKTWMGDLDRFLDGVTRGYANPFFTEVAVPLRDTWALWKSMRGNPRRTDVALTLIEGCAATDWRRAALEWLRRRKPLTRTPGNND
jgi:hypothetical protein